MEINTTEYKRVTVIEVSGRVDSSTANEFDEAVIGIIEAGQKNLIIDMAAVEFLSSAGLRTLVSARKAVQPSGVIVLAQPSKRVTDTLEIAGLDVLFETFPDRESAVGSV
ncbi:MAG: STAS domain-containing protein [Anaerolineales bacterium]